MLQLESFVVSIAEFFLICREKEPNFDNNRKKYVIPKYQREYGDWLNWNIPNTDRNVPIFASGWGDGAYPSYFGYDAEGNVCGVYIHFIDVAEEYDE